MADIEDSDLDWDEKSSCRSRKNAKEHVKQLQRLQEKDPEFYQFLKDHDKELLDFNDEDIDGDKEYDLEVDEESEPGEKIQKEPQKTITTAMVESWCRAIKEGEKLSAVRSLLRAYRIACHYGDDGSNNAAPKFSIISSSVFNKIMVFVMNEMDVILRGVLHAPSSGGKKETIMELTTTKAWKKNGSLMKLYLGNALHILTEMTDEQMISFTLKRVKASAVFLAAFPALLRKYIKVALHSWGTGRGALPVVSFLFLRDLCIRIGSDCIDTCLKGVYKAYVMNCKLSKSVSRSKQQHIHFLANCVTELYGVDIPSAYQHAFVFIRQLGVILRSALTERGNKAVKENKDKKQQEGIKSSKQHMDKVYQKVYDWQFIYCLELWTGVICAYNAESDFRPLAYPLAQIISGVACLVPTARFFPLRLRCVRMLNRLAGATGAFIPVSSYLLDMLEMKELNMRPVGGVGKAVNLLGVKQVDKTTLKTRAFQEACIYSVVDELTEHLAQWSYSPAFFELSFVPVVRLRSFCKCTDADRCRREVRELIRQVEANSEFTNAKRLIADFSPNDPAVESFLQAEKEAGTSPLSQFAAELRLRSQRRNDSMVESSVLVGAESSVFSSKLPEITEDEEDGDEEAVATVFSSSWLPQKKAKVAKIKAKASEKRSHQEYDVEGDEDVVVDLVLSSDDDDDEPIIDSASEDDEHGPRRPKGTQLNKKQGKEHGLNRPKGKQLNEEHKLNDSSKQNSGEDTSVKNPNKRKRPKRNARYGKKKDKF